MALEDRPDGTALADRAAALRPQKVRGVGQAFQPTYTRDDLSGSTGIALFREGQGWPRSQRMRTNHGSSPVAGRVVGIDPGLNVTGYAVVEPSPRGPFVVEAGVIRPRCPRGELGQRLDWIHRGIVDVLDAHPPGSVALEQLHSHVKPPAHRDPDGPCAGGDRAGRRRSAGRRSSAMPPRGSRRR